MAGPRPRIVMLVHNNVRGDSRVQKQARSIAELGWDVTLVGTSPDRRRWKGTIGAADVWLEPMEPGMHQRPHELRRSFPRDPVAYANPLKARWKTQHLQAKRADVGAAKAEWALRSPDLTGAARARAWASLQLKRIDLKIDATWSGLRIRRSAALVEKRLKLDAPIDRFATAVMTTLLGDRAWRRLDPDLWRYELALGKVVDRLEPDLIHANDFPVLGVAARAKMRASAKGRTVKLVWDAHEYVQGIRPWRANPRWLPAQIAHEREYAPYADAVVTVSGTLAELLQRDYDLEETPAVVLNTPDDPNRAPARDRELLVANGAGRHLWPPAEATDGEAAVPSLRERCGIGPDTPLMVYSGNYAPQRGLATVVEALPALPGVHAVFVANNPRGPFAAEMRRRVEELGVGDRVHLTPYVEYYQVVPYLAEADLGLIPIHHWPNHEIALITKFFEYSHARLPIVVSDVKTMSETVTATGQGEVFRAEDTEDFIRAVKSVLADPERYRSAYDGAADLDAWTWERQAAVLDGVYRRVLEEGRRP